MPMWPCEPFLLKGFYGAAPVTLEGLVKSHGKDTSKAYNDILVHDNGNGTMNSPKRLLTFSSCPSDPCDFGSHMSIWKV